MILLHLLQRLFALVSLAILAWAGWLAWSWWDLERDSELLGVADAPNDHLYWALGLLAFSLFGRMLVLLLLGRSGPGADAGRNPLSTVPGADGAALQLDISGAETGPILVFTHGWGLSQRIWGQARRSLGARFGLVSWDLPGVGRSGHPPQGWSIEGFAEDLFAVINSLPIDRPVILVGHSIGGMTSQTLCARHPELLNTRVVGLVLENTTYRNPLHTMILSHVLVPLEPVIRGVMRLDILLSPLVWLMNWQSYLSGSTHLAMRLAGFGTRPTRAVLDLSAQLPTLTSPAVQAHGNLAMFDWSVIERLPAVDVPALVFVGGRDLVTKDHAGETIVAALPNARIMRMEPAGHMGPFELPEDYNAAIAAFVEEATSKARLASPASVSFHAA